MSDYTLPRSERIRSLKAIRRLFSEGRGGFVYPIRYMALSSDSAQSEESKSEQRGVEVLFSVPKKFHKRANKRNLLKRRMREAYRLNRQLLVEKLGAQAKELDLALIYSAKELHSYKTIENVIRKVLEQVSATL
ncbi:MAG: ribonuclease P protein component [Alistipes sp.]|nr:ribonuclease P protein component [Alistipes sp.]MBQ5914044.1 ribonuclease P protein component [Alistipes sp.]